MRTEKHEGTLILYFSATGNCLAAAKTIAQNIGSAEVVNIAPHMRRTEPAVFEAEAIIFIYPAYAYGLPVMMRRFIRRNGFSAGYFAALTTYGTKHGGALGEAARLLRKKGLTLDYAAGIPSVENYVAIFGAQSEKKRSKRLALQAAAAEQVSESIAARAKNEIRTFRPFSSFVSTVFRIARPILPRFYRVRRKNCNGCGICARVCPATAAVLKNGIPHFNSKCEQCQACVHQCPKGAIKYFRKRSAASNYRHPDITLSELTQNSQEP